MGSKPKVSVKVVKSHTVKYTDRDGIDQSIDYKTNGPNGGMKIHSGGSCYIGTVSAVCNFAGIVMILHKIVVRIRVDGTLVAEPQLRKDDYFETDDDGNEVSRTGALVFDFLGDESRVEFAEQLRVAIPALAKRIKSARAALAKRAA